MIHYKTCELCGNEFQTNISTQKRCNKTNIKQCEFDGCTTKYQVVCNAAHGYHKYCNYHRIYNKPKICENCGDNFLGQDNAKYCNKIKIRACLNCNKEFEYICDIHKQKFCSRECQLKHLHRTYIPLHNQIMWGQYRDKMLACQRHRVKQMPEEQKMFIKNKINECNNKTDFSKIDSLAEHNKNYIRYTSEYASIYIITFKDKDYIKVGITYSDKSQKIKEYPNKDKVFKYNGKMKLIVDLEAIIHTIFPRVWQDDIKTGLTEFHKLSDLESIKRYIDLFLNHRFTKTGKFMLFDEQPAWSVLDHIFYYHSYDMRKFVVIPTGFRTDFASVPRLLWWLLPPQGDCGERNYGTSSILHDYLCSKFHKGEVTRKYADDTFLEAMLSVGVNKKLAYLMYFFVRLYAKIKRYK